jgi:hypothetical protein
MNELGAAAVACVRRGWYVFPVAPRGKAPITKRGMLDASTDEGLVAALDGQEAALAWSELCAVHGGRPRTLAAATGRGFHFYFAGQGRLSASRIASGVDTRGAGGYAILPPSVHANGSRYRWINPGAEPLPAPLWLLEALDRGTPEELAVGAPRRLPDGVLWTNYGRAALDGLREDMLAAEEGWRNDCLNRLAYRAGRLAAAGELDVKVAERVLVDAAVKAGLPEDEAVRTYRSGAGAGLLLPAAR